MSGLSNRALRLLGCAGLAALVYAVAPPPDDLRSGLALFALIGSLWMSQALHLSVTALLVPLLATLVGLTDLRTALSSFAHPIIFLFLGGFTLAAALQRQGLDRMLAHQVFRLAAGRRDVAVALLFGITALLSMWISNTATAAMMLPLALGLLRDDDRPVERMFVLLGVAYSASIGGIGTLVGSPPNAIAAAQAGIGFGEWMLFGVPLVGLLLPLMAGVLFLILRPRLGGAGSPSGVDSVAAALTGAQGATLAVFILTAAGWIFAEPIRSAFGFGGDIDSAIALIAVIALVAGGLVDWREVETRTQWGVLLLFGGGLALSAILIDSGASQFLAGVFTGELKEASPWVLLLGVVTLVVFLTEMVSNTASAALLIPIFLGVASTLDMPPVLFAFAIAASSSCAFMLPVATPPNAIVFGTQHVDQSTMMRCGLVLNLVCIVVITVVAAVCFAP